MRRPLLVALTLSVALGAAPARASIPDLFGFGVRAGALGGLGAADAEGYEATWINPAGVIGPQRRRLTVGYIGSNASMTLDGSPYDIDRVDGLLIGSTLPLPFGGVLKDRLALGMGFYLPFGVLNRARQPFVEQPRLAVVDSRTHTISILVSAAARLHSRVSLGVGVLALAALAGRITLRTDANNMILTQSEQQLVTSFAPVVGVRVVAHRRLKLGVALRGESRSRYDIQVDSDLGNALPLQLPTIRIAGTAQYDPLQMAMEGAIDVAAPLRLLVGVTWKHWSTYDSPVEKATKGATTPPSPNFHDTAVPRVGLELSGGRGRLSAKGRVGYFFEPSPAPQNATTPYVDADRHAVTAGFALGWAGRTISGELEAFGQLHVVTSSARTSGLLGAYGVSLGVDL